MTFLIPFNIPEQDLEPLYDHVHHAQSLKYMEAARLAFLEAIGAPSEALIRDGIFPVITRIDVSYKRELRSEPVTVTCEEVKIQGRSLIMKQRIINEKSKTCIEAVVESMFLSSDTKRAISVPEVVIKGLSTF